MQKNFSPPLTGSLFIMLTCTLKKQGMQFDIPETKYMLVKFKAQEHLNQISQLIVVFLFVCLQNFQEIKTCVEKNGQCSSPHRVGLGKDC